MPPSAIVSVPVPRLPMLTPELLLQVEPAPVTITVPSEPGPAPMLAVRPVLLTVPPFVIVSEPVPKLPILSPLGRPTGVLFQTEPGPVTVTAPFEPGKSPTEPPPPLFTVPPFWMVSVPVPEAPTWMVPLFVHVEPAPDTVTVPSEPGELPTNPPRVLATVPPFSMVSLPVPEPPITRFPVFVQLEPAPDTITVPCEPDGLPSCPVVVLSSPSPPAPTVTVPLPPEIKPKIRLFADAGPMTCAVPPLLMTASSAGVGTAAGNQLLLLTQIPVASTQVLTCACAGAETAATSAIVANDPDDRNLQAARVRDVVMSRRGRMGDSRRGSHPIISPCQPAKLGLHRRPQVANKEGSQS